MKSTTRRRILQAIFILGLAGVLLASFLTVTHYTGTPGIACPLKRLHGTPTCDIVNQSIYSEIMGIPIPLLAVFVYAAYSGMAYLLLTGKPLGSIKPLHVQRGLVFLSGASLLFGIYLVYILATVLKTACVYCIMAHTITAAIFLLSLSFLLGREKRK